MKKVFHLVIAAAAVALTSQAQAGRSYSTAGATISENFDSLPVNHATSGNPLNGAGFSANIVLQTSAGYSTGWVNDTDYQTSPDPLDVGVNGWYLYHNIFNAATRDSTLKNGASGHSRLNQGTGSGNAGGFWLFDSASNYGEKALGSLPTSAVTGTSTGGLANASAPMRIAFELVNNTGSPLTKFTLTYDGEQYLDGRSANPGSLRFSYSLNDTAASYLPNTSNTLTDTWGSGHGTYTRVTDLDFIAPTFGYTGPDTALPIDGNLAANRQADIDSTITGIDWEPGTSLFLLWENPLRDASGSNDGLAIDNVRFSATAVPEPASLALIGLTGLTLMRRRRR